MIYLQIADFWEDAQILDSFHHPNVFPFYGVVCGDPDGSLATVAEFMVNGYLKQLLRKNTGIACVIKEYFACIR